MFRALAVLVLRTRTIYRVVLPDGTVESMHTATGPAPDGIVIDESAGRIYWTTMVAARRAPDTDDGFDFSARNGGVHTAA
ncbi:MAG: hypothetical protein L0H84_01010 [Pseudonocardia sp.]|nr:hypothetical protein [Pseudonocardia sp.]